jgi:hypothetical protein
MSHRNCKDCGELTENCECVANASIGLPSVSFDNDKPYSEEQIAGMAKCVADYPDDNNKTETLRGMLDANVCFNNKVRVFETGATRDTDEGKLDFEGFLSPRALKVYAEYMHKHRLQSDGNLRDSDNWQKGIPSEQCLKSMWRHLFEVWAISRGMECKETMKDSLCGVIFNAMCMLHNDES